MLRIPLINKETALGLLQHKIGHGRNPKQIEEEKVGGVRKKSCSSFRRQTQEARQNLAGRPQPCDDTQINRNVLI